MCIHYISKIITARSFKLGQLIEDDEYRVDSRARECDNYAYFAILARNFELAA